MNDDAALVLFSGGQDSATCLAWALDRYAWVETVGFAYGQRHAVELACRAPLRAGLAQLHGWGERLGPDHLIDLGATLAALGETAMTAEIALEMSSDGLPNSFVPGRNLLFFTYAAALAYRRGLRRLVGGMCETDFSGYPDCRDDTVKALQLALNLGMGPPLRAGDAADVARQGGDLAPRRRAGRRGAGGADHRAQPHLLSRRPRAPARLGLWLRYLPSLRPARPRLVRLAGANLRRPQSPLGAGPLGAGPPRRGPP